MLVDYIVYKFYAIIHNLRCNLLQYLQQRIRVSELVIWQSENSLCIINKRNSISDVSDNSNNRDFRI